MKKQNENGLRMLLNDKKKDKLGESHDRQGVRAKEHLRVINGTYQVWEFVRQGIMEFLFEVYTKSCNHATQRRM